MPKTYIGFVIDMSQSMSENWNVLDKKVDESKMKSIKNAFNYIFGHGSDTRLNLERKQVNLFALGMGIKLKESLVSVSKDNPEEEIPNSESESERQDRIIDIFSFTRLIPNSDFIAKLKKEIKNSWEEVGKKLLEGYKKKYRLDEKIDHKYLENLIHKKINLRARKSWLFKLHKAVLSKKPSISYYIGLLLMGIELFRLDDWEEVIDTIIYQEKDRYLDNVICHAQDVFDDRVKDYKEFIYAKLEEFLKTNLDLALLNNAIGFSFDNVVNYFEMEEAKKLIEKIYKYLLRDMRENIGVSHSIEQMLIIPLWSQLKLGYCRSIDIKEAYSISLQLMRKTMFDEIQPFVQKVAAELFEDVFNEVLKQQIYNWIYFAERAEITLQVSQIPTFFPDTEEDEQVFNNEFMFGSTPIASALEMAAVRLMRTEKTDQKILVILSDGDFKKKKMESVSRIASMLKKENVVVVCFYVSGYKSITFHEGYNNMQLLSSKVEDIVWQNDSQTILEKDKDLLFKVDSEESIKNSLKKVLEIAT